MQDTYYIALRAAARDMTSSSHMEKKSSALIKGMWGAGAAAAKAAKGNRLKAAKDTFTALTKGKGHETSYDVGRALYHLPQRILGTMTYGDWGAAPGMQFIGRRLLGATGKWTLKDGKPLWQFDKNLIPASKQTMFQRAGNKLYELGEKGINKTDAAAEKVKAIGDQIAARGGARNWMLGKGLKWGTSVGVGAPLVSVAPGLAAGATFGFDSNAANTISNVAGIADYPFRFMNPWGLALEGTMKGMEWGAGKIRNLVVDNSLKAAEQAARETAEGIANGVQEKGRLGFLAGAFSPEYYANKIRSEASNQITDRMSALRQQYGM